LAWTHQVFAPPDSSRLRRLLLALDAWLKRNRQFSQIRWHRKEQWFSEDYSNPANEPFHA
jgi:hypothetical protein